MTQRISILTLSLLATAAITAERFVDASGAPATAAGNALGAAESGGAIGDLVPVAVLGTATIVAGAAIAKGAAIEVGATGKGVTLDEGIAVARALEAALADGDRIEVLLIPN